MYSTCYSCHILMKLHFSRQTLEKYLNISFNISVQWKPGCSMRADGRTHGRNVILVGNSKVIVVIRNFANAQSLRKQLVY